MRRDCPGVGLWLRAGAAGREILRAQDLAGGAALVLLRRSAAGPALGDALGPCLASQRREVAQHKRRVVAAGVIVGKHPAIARRK
jgi:hypothetical protein